MLHEKMIALKTYCKTNELDVKHARRLARAGKFGDAQKMFDTVWVVSSDMPVPDMPTGTRGRARADGRSRYVVYVANDAELASIAAIIGDTNIINPRDLAKQRRIEKRDAALAESETETDDNG